MMKMILLTGTMAIAAPVVAQTAAPVDQTSPAPMQTAPVDAVPTQTPPTQTPPVQTAPTTDAAPAQAAPADTAAAPSQNQVAQVVDQQFGTYDKDGNGALSKTEFGAWMTALKTAANAKSASAAEETAWNDAAFKQADGDKSATVTKTELTGFLVKGASGAS